MKFSFLPEVLPSIIASTSKIWLVLSPPAILLGIDRKTCCFCHNLKGYTVEKKC